jgi:phenylalanyl-tRNA synthetase beta chain
MKVPVSWLRDFVDVPADAREVATRLATCGFAVEGIEGDTIDFEVTANRPDCLSVYGFAREAATAFGLPLRPIETTNVASSGGAPIPVAIDDPACGRYALAFAEITVGPSPDWLAARLTAAGVRPINNVVDVTNYVMLELGHPMHAFDAATLAGPEIHVRLARAGERLTTLDGQARTLEASMLVIADRDRAVALAGVMGGSATEVSRATRSIALESAWFQPASVRVTARRLGLKTEASARFERGADPAAPMRALARAIELLVETGVGRPTAAPVDVYPTPATPRRLQLSRDHVARLLSDRIPDQDIERTLERLEFRLSPGPGGWTVDVPSFRVDVTREADLIEDIGRHWGFDRIPTTFPPLRTTPRPSSPGAARARLLRRVLCGVGLQEAVTFTFIDREAATRFAHAGGVVPIANPLSEKFAVLRPSLLPGLLDSLAYSRRRESPDVRLFEAGAVFSPSGERQQAGWVLAGSRGEHWSGSSGPVDFFDAKGLAELVALSLGAPIDVGPTDDLPWFAAGRRARLVLADGTPVGSIGQILPAVVAEHGLGTADEVFGGEVDLDLLSRAGGSAVQPIHPIPRHPSVVRDLSILVDERLPAATVRGTIRTHAPATLVAVREFDRYQGKGVPNGQVSLSVRLTFRDADRTLTDDEVQQAVEAIVAALTREHGATLRGQ